MATILSVDAAHDDGEFPLRTSEQGDRIAALLRTPVPGRRPDMTDRIRPVVGICESIITGAARTARLSSR